MAQKPSILAAERQRAKIVVGLAVLGVAGEQGFPCGFSFIELSGFRKGNAELFQPSR